MFKAEAVMLALVMITCKINKKNLNINYDVIQDLKVIHI